MQSRYRAAATALLLTATTGLAAAGGAAQASGSHHTSDRAARTLTITVKTKDGSIALSDSRFRPGNTIFKVKNAGSKGLIQVLRLKAGYTELQAFSDFAAAFPSDDSTPVDVDAVKRIDKNVVFYGGIETPKKPSRPANKWAVKIDKAATYIVLNLDTNALTTFKTHGDRQKRALPAQDGWINAKSGPNGVGNVFKAGKHNAASGWMSTTNSALEPHFVELDHVKKSATNKQVADFISGSGAPTFFAKDGASTDTGVISPGHTFLWSYSMPKGQYLAWCFWPSNQDGMGGMPHAFMGMFTLTHLG